MSERDEHYWAERAFDRLDQLHDKLTDAAIASGRQALQAALLLNGGACVALLGFLASTFSDDTVTPDQARLVNAVVASLVWFGWGALLAATGAGGGYLTNYCYGTAAAELNRKFEWPYTEETAASRGWRRVAHILAAATILVGMASLTMFVWGLAQISQLI